MKQQEENTILTHYNKPRKTTDSINFAILVEWTMPWKTVVGLSILVEWTMPLMRIWSNTQIWDQIWWDTYLKISP